MTAREECRVVDHSGRRADHLDPRLQKESAQRELRPPDNNVLPAHAVDAMDETGPLLLRHGDVVTALRRHFRAAS